MDDRESTNFLRCIWGPEDDAELDIVAVHGLNPNSRRKHAYLTWTAANGKLWLRDFLPKELPKARILLFGYNASLNLASTAGVSEQADNLLNRLGLQRKGVERRPVIFICHSLGGIILKKALVNAKLNSRYKSIRSSCYGIVFFSTPHRGLEVAESTTDFPNTFFEALRKDSLFASEIQGNFRHQLEDYRILSFFETAIPRISGLAVDRESATLGLPGTREGAIALDGDHESICKFESINGDDYEQVGKEIVYLARDAINSTLYLSKEMMQDLCLSNPEDYRFDLIMRKGKRTENTCQWVLREPAFKEWEEKEGSRILWIYGKPGVGKTMISDFLVETFELYNPKVSLTYFFCNSQSNGRNAEITILRGFLWQILTQNLALSKEVETDYAQRGKDIFEKKESLRTLFLRVVKDERLAKVYWVIDGLDEVGEDQRSDFISFLAKEFPSFSTKIKLAITSRKFTCRYMKDLAKASAMNEITVELADANKDINEYIEDRCQALPQDDPELLNEVRLELGKRAEKMFLWVFLVVEKLKKSALGHRLPKDIIKELPESLEDLYKKILLPVSEKDLEIIERMLTWIAITARPLTEDELGAALAIRNRHKGCEITNRKRLTGDLHLCEQLITRSGEIYLIHKSLKEYLFNKNPPDYSNTTHSELAEVCLLVLINSNPGEARLKKNDQSQSLSSLHQEDGSYQEDMDYLRGYAINHWHHHLRECDNKKISDGLKDLLRRFLSKVSNLEDWLEQYWPSCETWVAYPKKKGFTPLHLAAYLGIGYIIEDTLSNSFSLRSKMSIFPQKIKDSDGWTPLHWAARQGDIDVVKLLFKHGFGFRHAFGIDVKTSDGLTALHLAARQGHLEVLKLLILRGAAVDAMDNNSKTALYWATMYQRSDCQNELLNNGASEKQKIQCKKDGQADLFLWAVRRGNDILVKDILRDRQPDLDLQNLVYDFLETKPSVLHMAVEKGMNKVVEILLRENADVKKEDMLEQTALHLAAKIGNVKIVEELWKGWEDHENRLWQEGLHLAVRHGNIAVVELLLKEGVDKDSRDKYERTVLHIAALYRDDRMVELLLESNADPAAKDVDGWSVLHVAAEMGSVSIMKLLVEGKADVRAKDLDGWTILHAAAYNGDKDVVRLVLKYATELNCVRDLNSRNSALQTPLDLAIQQGNDVAVALILKEVDSSFFSLIRRLIGGILFSLF